MSRNKMHVRRGDQVQVISGNYKGARGQVLRAIPSKEQVVVEGVAMRKRHQGLAPSISAASYISRGMLCNPPRATTIMKGKPSQVLVTTLAVKAVQKEENQETWSRPRLASSWFIPSASARSCESERAYSSSIAASSRVVHSARNRFFSATI